jgi:NAD(P)-dependent dehydrogenase (short-subunit alcohol dehydrogenase family)
MAQHATEANVPKKANDKTQIFDFKQLMAMYDFTGRTAVITGGAGILGSEFACALAGCGAHLAILDINLTPAKALLERLGERAGQAALFECDVLNTESLNKAAAAVVARFGKVDCLINAAGGNRAEATTSPELKFFDLKTEALRWITELNLLGTVLPCQAFGKIMVDQDYGAILNIASVNSFRPLTRGVAYAAGKGGVSNFTQWLAVHMAQEYSPRIRVNAIAPGFFITTQNQFLLADAKTGEYTPRAKTVVAHTPMGRFGRPEELLGGMLWLLSPAASFVTGSVVFIDGGFTAYSGV